MKFLGFLCLFFCCILAFINASTVSWSPESNENINDEINNDWNCEYAKHPDAKYYIKKVSKRIDKLENTERRQHLKERIYRYGCEQLKQCKNHYDNGLNKHCIGQLIASTMSLINRLERNENDEHFV